MVTRKVTFPPSGVFVAFRFHHGLPTSAACLVAPGMLTLLEDGSTTPKPLPQTFFGAGGNTAFFLTSGHPCGMAVVIEPLRMLGPRKGS